MPMKKTKSFLSAVLAGAMLTSMFTVGAAAETQTKDTGVSAEAVSAAINTNVSSGADASTFSWDNATVYFLLTDRFNNGDKSNDNAYGRQDINVGDQRATFHGGDFKGITDKIEEGYFNDLGVNAIWLTAPYEQIHGYILGGSDFAHYSYHGYYVLDYTETDAAYGTKEEFKKMVDTAHEHGIRIVMDIVMNHAGYNSMQDMNEFNFGTLKSGWEGVYQSANLGSYHDYIDYTASTWSNWWGGDWIRAGLPGYTEGGNDPFTMSLTGLPDFRTEQTSQVGIPALLKTKWTKEGTLSAKESKYGTSNTVTGFISTWLADWVREYGVDGFRCDTAKHVELSSWKQLKDACTSALAEWKSNNPDKKLDDLPFWMTGECWDHTIGWGYDDYYKSGGFDSMINFETQGGGKLATGTLASVYQSYADTINTNDNFNQLSYLSSHDSTLARGDMYHLGSALLMLPGAVQIYYGDETERPLVSGCPSDGNGGAGHSLRSDMNWNSMNTSVLEHWQKVGTFRNNHVAVGAGANSSLTANSGVAFSRTYDKNGVSDKIAAVVDASANTSVTVDVSSLWTDGTNIMNTYDGSVDSVSGGKITFNSGEHGTILMEEISGGIIVSVRGGATFDTTEQVTLALDGVDSAKVSVDGGKKFIAKNGDTFTIGENAYPGDTIEVVVEYVTDAGDQKTKSFKFKKNDDGSGGSDSRSDKAIVHVYSQNALNIYAWCESTPVEVLSSAWPGTALSAKDDDGWYVIDFGTTEKYKIILNNGSDQSADSSEYQGEIWVDGSTFTSPKIFTSRKEAMAAIGIDIPESKLSELKTVCRSIKNLDKEDYENASYNAAYKAVTTEADPLIAKGADADDSEVNAMLTKIEGLKAKLVLTAPTITSMAVGATTIKGKAVCGTTVTVVISGKSYTATADDITGEWSVTVPAITSSTTAKITASNSFAKSKEVTADPNGSYVDPDSDSDSDSDTDPDSDTDSDSDSDSDIDPVVKGDVNGDGEVTLRDATLIQQKVANLKTFTAAQERVADLNGDGEVTLRDATMVQQAVANLITIK